MKFLAVVLWMVVIASIFAALSAIPTWLLWNWLMPEVFGLPSVNLLQAFGLILLSGFIFGSRNLRVET